MKRSVIIIMMIMVLAAPVNALAEPYTIQRGDKLHKIASSNGLTIEDILAVNPHIKKADLIITGNTIEIPATAQRHTYKTYTVAKGDCLYDIAEAFGVPMKDIQRLTPGLNNPSLLFVGQTLNIPSKEQGGDEPTQESPAALPEAAGQDEPQPADQAEPQASASPMGELTPDAGVEHAQSPVADAGSGNDISAMERQVLELVNEQRLLADVQPLEWDEQVAGLARIKSADMAATGQLSHTSEQLGSPFKMLRDNGVPYKTASENIARGQRSAQEVVDAWMASTGHRESMLNPSFTHMGMGIAADAKGRLYWTQLLLKQ